MTKPKVNVDKTCVFAVCNQTGKMLEKRGKQKYCMIIQNLCFEQSLNIPEGTGHNFVPTSVWDELGYEDVIKLNKHPCKGCRFYKSLEQYKLVPSNLPVRYAWTVERREENGI